MDWLTDWPSVVHVCCPVILRLALSNVPNRVGFSPPHLRSSFQNIALSSSVQYWTMDKPKNPVISRIHKFWSLVSCLLGDIHHAVCSEMFRAELFYLVYAFINAIHSLRCSIIMCLMWSVRWNPTGRKPNASYAKFKYTVTIQHNFLRNKTFTYIYCWFIQFKETESMLQQK
jgi:hypothetical protein